MNVSVKELLELKKENESLDDFISRIEDAMDELYDVQDERDKVSEEVAKHCDAIAGLLDASAVLVKHEPDDNEVFIHVLLSEDTDVDFRKTA